VNDLPSPEAGRTGESKEDARAMAEYGVELAEAIRVVLPGWVMRCVISRCEEAGLVVDDTVVGAAAVSGTEAARRVGREVSELLSLDIDSQRSNPMELLRGAVRYPTAVLDVLGVEPVVRDHFAKRAFPDDPYDLTPASFGAVDETLHDPGLRWGAAKAHVHMARRRHDGVG
jgi:hypothetical protein